MNLHSINIKTLDSQIFSDTAWQAAEFISRAGDSTNKASQLRKFYDELAMWDDKIHRAKNKQEEYAKSAPFIHMLKAKAAYAQGRKHVDKNFIDIFNRLMTQIDNPDTLRHAKLFFEAMLGFRKAAESK